MYILCCEIIEFDVKQSWTELCWIPLRIVPAPRRHKSEMSTSESLGAASTAAHVSANWTSVTQSWENWQNWSPETHQLSSAYTKLTLQSCQNTRFVQLIDQLTASPLSAGSFYNSNSSDQKAMKWSILRVLNCEVLLCDYCDYCDFSVVCQFEMNQRPRILYNSPTLLVSL